MRSNNELSSFRKRDVAVILSIIHDESQTEFIRALIKKGYEYGYRIIIFSVFTDFYLMDSYDHGEMHTLDLISYEQTEAIIILGTTFHNDELLRSVTEKAKKHNVFTVCIDKHFDNCCYIGYDYVSAFETIVRHVITEHNCRCISVVAGIKGNIFSDERIECCRRVMKEYGLELDENRIIYGDFRAIETEKAFERFMDSGLDMPDAFICCNDIMGIMICKKLREHGYNVPDDVIVTGFDGIPEVEYNFPRLTTAKQDIQKAAELSIELVRKYFNNEKYENSYIIEQSIDIAKYRYSRIMRMLFMQSP